MEWDKGGNWDNPNSINNKIFLKYNIFTRKKLGKLRRGDELEWVKRLPVEVMLSSILKAE